MKAILPSLREKKRYIAFEVIADRKLKESTVRQVLQNASLSYLGIRGTAHAGLMFIGEQWNDEKQRGLIKVNHNCVESTKASLLFITHAENQPVIFKSRGVSGVLNKAVKKYIAG